MPHIVLTGEPLDRAAVVGSVTTTENGAVVTFEGIVRNASRGQRVSHLVYEAYEPMALAALETIAGKATKRWGVLCGIAHRLGSVAAGECSVVVAVSSPHRAAAFEACRWLMESLKAEVPIWKKEFAEAGSYWIEGSEAVPSPHTAETHDGHPQRLAVQANTSP